MKRGGRSLILAASALAVAGALAYVVTFTLNAATIMHDLLTNSDAVSPMVMAQTLASPGNHGHVTAIQAGYTIFDTATAPLPFANFLWMALPFALILGAFALMVRSNHRIAGGWAALLDATILLSPTPFIYWELIAQAFHGTTWLGAALLPFFVVRWCSRAVKHLRIEIAIVSLITGLCIADDVFLIVVGFIPFLITGAVLFWISAPGYRRNVFAVFATAAGSLICTALGFLILHAINFGLGLPAQGPRSLSSLRAVVHHFHLLINGVRVLFIPGSPVTGTSIIWDLLVTAIVAAAFGVAAWVLIRRIRSQRRMSSAPQSTTEIAYLTYWISSAAVVVGSFLAGSEAIDETSFRYLYPLILASAAIFPVLATNINLTRIAVAAASITMSILGALAIATAAQDHVLAAPPMSGTDTLVAALEDHGLTYGYSPYWLSAAITWETQGKVTIRPATEIEQGCHVAGQGSLCPALALTVQSWYAAQQQRTFVVVDPALAEIQNPPGPEFGPPQSVFTAGRWTIYVYDYDVAQRFSSYGG